MGKLGRALLKGEPLTESCYRAQSSGVEYCADGIEYYGCYGLMDYPYNYNDECLECGAFVNNIENVLIKKI